MFTPETRPGHSERFFSDWTPYPDGSELTEEFLKVYWDQQDAFLSSQRYPPMDEEEVRRQLDALERSFQHDGEEITQE